MSKPDIFPNPLPLLSVKNLCVNFGSSAHPIRAVNDVSLSIRRGETLALVGESGCGKTTTGMAVCGLQNLTSGSISFDGKSLQDDASMTHAEQFAYRKRIQIVFQDPNSSLNPRMNLATTLEQPLRLHGATKVEAQQRADWLLEKVGLNPKHKNRFPHEFSGGQRQRIGIARALALEPELIICDEAVSALDVSVQAQIINLLVDIQEEFGLSYLFISHDLAVVEHIADRIAVMYLGKIVEEAPWDKLFSNPQHPYTKTLLSAIPVPDPRRVRPDRINITSEIPNPISPPSGCSFHPRCPAVMPQCNIDAPKLEALSDTHFIACPPAVKRHQAGGEA